MNMEKKNILVSISKVILIVIAVMALLFACLFTYYMITKEDIKKYVSKDFYLYVKVDSLSKAYNNLIDLKAADMILSGKDYSTIYKALLDFRSSKYSRNSLISSILDMKTSIIIDRNYSPTILLDLGLKSMLLKVSPIAAKFLEKNSDFSIEPIKKKGYVTYKLFVYSSNESFYVSIRNNLLFFSLSESSIDGLYESKNSGNNIYDDEDYYHIQSQIRKDGMAEIYFNTKEIVDSFTRDNADLYNLIGKFKLDKRSSMSVNISNDGIAMSSYTRSGTEDKTISDFLKNDANELSVVKYLPDDTNICTSVNFKSFEEFYKLALYLQDGKYDDTIKKVDDACRLLLNIGIKDLLFSWVGDEIGAFTSNVSADPVIYARIKDRGKLDKVFDQLVASSLVDKSDNIVFDGVKMNKIKLPDFVQMIVRSFVKGFDTPFYIIKDDFIFFSMNGDALADMLKKYESDKTLPYDPVYKEITGKTSRKGNIFLYFNLGLSTPRFLQGNGMISDIIKLYEKGSMTINLNDDSMKVDFSAAGVNEKKTRLFSGFPKNVKEGISSPVVCRNVAGSNIDEMVYIRQDKRLVISDVNNNPIDGFPAKIDGDSGCSPMIIDDSVYVFTDDGAIDRIDFKGTETSPYPIKTQYKGSFAPVLYGKNLVFFSNASKKLCLLDINDGKEKVFKFDFKSPLLSPPEIFNDFFLFYPKSFGGSVYVTDNEGNLEPGWDGVEAGGIGYGTPVSADIDGNGLNEILFLTQAGNLNAWTFEGKPLEKFPVKLDGVFYIQPVVGKIGPDGRKSLVCLDKDGKLFVISPNGEVELEKKIKDADSKDRNLMLFDVDKDGNDEMIIYGASNNLLCLDNKGNELPGFPVKGSYRPDFTDFDSDGNYEMVTASFDKNIYVYSIPKVK
jgi:hypothetical protein